MIEKRGHRQDINEFPLGLLETPLDVKAKKRQFLHDDHQFKILLQLFYIFAPLVFIHIAV
jgi:hypothetical protein